MVNPAHTRPNPAEMRRVALAAHAAGLCVLPPREDGSKAPSTDPDDRWARWQRERSTVEEILGWYGPCLGMGIVCGKVSGNVEAFEFDDRDTYERFLEVARETGLGELVDRIRAGYEEASPSDGIHWLYRCAEISGSKKLARHLKRPEEMRDPNDMWKVLIETRGEGGYIIVAPSNGRVHPTGKPYRLLRGSFSTTATIGLEERWALWELARTFDQMPPGHDPEAIKPPVTTPGGRPGDDFNARADWGIILEPKGWSLVYQRNGIGYWRRPGKDRGVSATTNYQDSGLLYVFSTSTDFEPERAYSKFSAYALLGHSGDFRTAARALKRQGYGTSQVLHRRFSHRPRRITNWEVRG